LLQFYLNQSLKLEAGGVTHQVYKLSNSWVKGYDAKKNVEMFNKLGHFNFISTNYYANLLEHLIKH
jgi:hypothetical protein